MEKKSNTTLTCVGGILHKGQLEIIQDVLNSNAMFHTIVCPRQWGKSFFAIQLLLYYALNHSESKLMFCSPVYSQASKVYKEMMDGIRDTGVVKKFNAAENSVIFSNNSEVFFKSVQLPDNLRGYSIDYMILDEFAMYKKDVFESVLRPMLTVRGKKCFLLSTPKGKNTFYNMYMKGQDPLEPRYKSYKGYSEDNPYANKDEIEDARRVLPEALFRQEYSADFIDGNGSVFENLNLIATLNDWQKPIANEIYYAGIDIALTGDYLVMTVLNKKGDIVYCYRDHKKGFQHMLGQMEKVFKDYNPRSTLVETNGIGNGIYEFIAKLHKSVSPFVTSNESKQDIIEDLIYDFQEQAIHIPTKEFYSHYFEELEDFGFNYSPKSRKVTYSAISGHDDCVISLALANHAKKTGANRGSYNLM